MKFLSPRTLNTCTSGKQWYVCSAGDFRGCCSSDPCTTGVCPDDGSSTTSSTATTAKSTSTSSDTSTTPGTVSTDSTASSPTASESAQTTTPSTSSTTSGASLDDLTSMLTASTSTARITPNNTSTKSTHNGAIIGGVVGGVAGLVLCAVFLWFCWRRNRRGKSFDIILHRSVSAQSLHDRELSCPAKTALSPSEKNARHLNGEHSTSPLISNEQWIDDDSDSFPSLPHLAPSTTGSNANTNTPGPESLSLSLPALAIGHSESSTLSSGVNTFSTRDLPQLPPMHLPSSELLACIPRGAGLTPELPDTGFYRQRAELASHAQSELINVPLDQRRRKTPPQPQSRPDYRHHKPGSRSWDSANARSSGHPSPSTSSDTDTNTMSPRLMARQTARRIITDDGVVLGANLDRYSVPSGLDVEKGKKSERNTGDHVMSFMNYDRGIGIMDWSVGAGMVKEKSEGNHVERPVQVMTVLEEDSFSPMSDVPPAYDYEPGGVEAKDVKSPSGTMGLGLRGLD